MHARNRLNITAAGRIAATIAATAALTIGPLAVAPQKASAAPTVRLMVDPGHGGKDPGAVSGGLLEKDSSLQISKKVVESAKRQGWTVAMTRDTDVFVPLQQRPAKAAKSKSTALVSIHSNSAGPSPKGNMTIYRGTAGAKLGQSIMNELDPLTPYGDIGNKSDVRGLAVLRGAKQPAVIVELLNLANQAENAQLKDPAAQSRMAEAVVKGLANYHGVKYYPPAAPKPAAAPAPKAPATPTAPKAAPTAAPKAAPAPNAAPMTATKVAPKATDAKVEPKVEPKVATERKAAPERDADRPNVFERVWDMLFR